MSRYLVMQNWTFLSIKQLDHLKSRKPWWLKYSLLPPLVALLIFKQVVSAIALKLQSLKMLLHTPKYPAESTCLGRVLMRWLRRPHVSIVSTSTMRLTHAPILFLQVQLFVIVWVTLYGRKKRLLGRQTRSPHVDFTPRTLTTAPLSSGNLGASGVERHMWAPTKLHQHWSAATLRCDILPWNTLLYFLVLSHTLLFVTHYQRCFSTL